MKQRFKIMSLFVAGIVTAGMLAACGASETGGTSSGGASTDSPAAAVLENKDELIEMKDLAAESNGKPIGYQLEMPEKGEEIAVITMESGDVIKLRFFADEAPLTVYNFKKHAVDGYYNGLTFHRILQGFMIQGGDPNGTGTGGESVWGDAFADEFNGNLVNINGSVAMANSGPNTNGSQFFINNTESTGIDWEYYEHYFEMYKEDESAFTTQVAEKWIDLDKVSADMRTLYDKHGGNIHLDGAYSTNGTGHTVFAQVFEGMDNVKKIAAVATDDLGMPDEPVVMKTIEIMKYEG